MKDLFYPNVEIEETDIYPNEDKIKITLIAKKKNIKKVFKFLGIDSDKTKP